MKQIISETVLDSKPTSSSSSEKSHLHNHMAHSVFDIALIKITYDEALTDNNEWSRLITEAATST